MLVLPHEPVEAGTTDLGRTKGRDAGDFCYLTPCVRDAIRHLPRIVGNPCVFTGNAPGGRACNLCGSGKKAASLVELSPELEGFHLHDLRHHLGAARRRRLFSGSRQFPLH